VAATAANAIALGERALDRLDQGRFLRLIIEGESGAMIVYPIDGSDAALVALVDPDAKMGLASMAMRQSIQQIASILARAGPALD
jgi:predicted regulator of Ras-like GTPase activity (Roadblock/LC7/MglB family)